MKEFKGETDNYSLLNTEKKNEMSPSLFEQSNNNNNITFGDSPCKLYSNFLLEGKIIKANAINNSIMCLPIFPSKDQFTIPSYYLPFANSKSQNISQQERKSSKRNSNKRKDNEFINKKHISIGIDISNDDYDINNSSNNYNNKKQSTKQRSNNHKERNYKCAICSWIFSSPQGLGGHMSRTHKDQSIKFQKKKHIRLLREPQRKLLEKAKIIICERHDKDYSNLIKTKRGKGIVKSLVLNHKKEYKEIRKQLKEESM